jgi:hypothetical protein
VEVCRSISEQLAAPHPFLLFSNGEPAELSALISAVDPLIVSDQGMNDCSDLVAMSEADLLVASRSSFSLWAAALSRNPYIWHEPILVAQHDKVSLWDHGSCLENPQAADPRGVPVDDTDRAPAPLIDHRSSIIS